MIRSWNNMTKLGGVLISSITDIPSFAYEFAYHGAPFFSSLAKGIGLAIKGRGTADQQRILTSCGVFFDSMNQAITDRFFGNDAEGKSQP